MKLLKNMLQKTGAVLAKATRFPLRFTRFAIPATPMVRDMLRAAAAGTILFAFAGAGLGARGGLNTYKLDAASAGATVTVGWGYGWVTWAAAGLAAGALAGALSGFLAHWRMRERGGAIALLVIGSVGGVLAGATWGGAVARERVAHVRAQPASAAKLNPKDAQVASVVSGPIRLSASIDREFNVPLLAFMLLGGSVVGALAARGMAGTVRFAHVQDPQDRGFAPEPPQQQRPSRSQSRAHAGAF